MNIEKVIEDGRITLKISGWLETKTAAELQAQVDELSVDTEELVMDLEGLEYISSAGLRQIVAAHKKMNGRLTLIHVQPEIMEVLEMAGFVKRLHIES